MHEYDVALKSVLTWPGGSLLRDLVGSDRLEWLNVELPRVSNLRVDVLGETPERELIHFEFQSRNQKGFALRMAQYSFAIAGTYGRFPRQFALYVGRKPLRMKSEISTPDLTFRFRLIDIRELDGEALLASQNLSDNVIAVLTKRGEEPGTVRRILKKIAAGPRDRRAKALAELTILAGLRGLTDEVGRETKKMPITEDIMDHGIIGPAIRKGREQGRAEGLTEGQREILLSLIEKRFGRVTPRTRKRLAALNPEELKALGLRLLDARTMDDLFIDV